MHSTQTEINGLSKAAVFGVHFCTH